MIVVVGGGAEIGTGHLDRRFEHFVNPGSVDASRKRTRKQAELVEQDAEDKSGRVIYIGYAKEQVAYETRLFVQKELDILGSRNALPEDFREVIRMLEAHRFPVDEAVTHIVPLEEAPAILEAWNQEPARFTKIMIEIAS